MKYYKFGKNKDRNCDVKVFAAEEIYNQIEDTAIKQLLNASKLPGIKRVIGLPDIHQGYGLPIGGVMASDPEKGIISPGAVGFDINCGVRLLSSNLDYHEVKNDLKHMINMLRKEIPAGVGKDSNLKFNQAQFKKIVEGGVPHVVSKLGFGLPEDITSCEEEGKISRANASKVSVKALKRGQTQLGTLGSGNHFVEIQRVEEVYSSEVPFTKDQLCIMIHTGSRGYGHQIAKDYINLAKDNIQKYNFTLPSKNLASFPAQSKEGQDYLQAMSCAANFAFANRQLITHQIRETLWQFNIDLDLYYDITHNIVKKEKHTIGRKEQEVLVHRKGATTPNEKGFALIPGSMGTSSYLVKAVEDPALKEAFNSLAHGAGRKMSRRQAKKTISNSQHQKSLTEVEVVSGSNDNLLDESPAAYKDINLVIDSLQKTSLAKPAVKLKPLAVLKG